VDSGRAASRQPGLGVDDLPASSLRCVRLCFQQGLGEEHKSVILGYCRGSSGGRVPKDWFDIWGTLVKPTLENRDVALPGTESR
jgi:hypothetical protein